MITLKKIFVSFGIIIFSVLIINGQPNVEFQQILNPDATTNGQFGISSDISGDYAVVGAIGNDTYTGAAYVYHLESEVWTKVAKLNIAGATTNEYMGNPVAIYGDIVVIGMSENKTAYVFVKPPGGWADMTETAKLTASDAQPDDYFGSSVCIYEDFIVVGDLYQDNGGNASDDKGAAYIFEKPVSGWTDMTETSKIIASGLSNKDYFGCDVAIHGDYLAVGAKGDDGLANYTGAVYVFYNNSGTWTEQAKLTASDAEASDGLGFTVDIYGDYIITSAYWKNVSGTGSGAAYVFEKPATGWTTMTQTAKLTPSDGVEYDYFSRNIAITDQYAVASAHYEHNGGQIYFYEMPAGGWVDMTEDNILTPSGSAVTFGKSLSLTNDNLIIGDFGVSSYSGTVYIFSTGEPGITTHPENIESCIGDEVDFTVNGNYLTSYQWQESTNGTDFSDINDNSTYSGTTSNTLTITVNETLNNNQYRCFVTFDDGSTSGDEYSNAAILTLDTENPTITCINNQTINLLEGETEYTVTGTEFDPVSTNDNCAIESIINDFNNLNTLDGVTFPIGTTTVTWTVTDATGNEAECSFNVVH